ncbi:MAG TPA: hypothetical protein PLG42_02395, partial [Bacteroidales bacterium]|nr:hypothetical protein [Bacteroidales bacterium]
MERWWIHIVIFSLCLICGRDYLFSQPLVYKIEKMPFSSSQFNDIAPVIIKDGIIFCSDRRASSAKNVTTFNEERLYNLYFSARRDTLKWREPYEIKISGDPVLFTGPVSVSADGSTIYFTSSVLSGKAARKRNIKNTLGIYVGELSG